MSSRSSRKYVSARRAQAASATRDRILEAARTLFLARGVEDVRMAEIAEAAGVAEPTIYATFKSREGILRALMQATLFGPHYQAALAKLEGESDPERIIALTPGVSRAIYEGEMRELGVLRDVAAWSPTLRAIEREFDEIRYANQEQRLRDLFAAGRARPGLTLPRARRILWMYTSRDVYRMLVVEGGWTPAAYERWLRETLLETLVAAPSTTPRSR